MFYDYIKLIEKKKIRVLELMIAYEVYIQYLNTYKSKLDVKEYEEICTVVYSFYIQYENVCLERLVEVIIKMFKTKDTIENISEKQIMDEVYNGGI